MEIQNFRDFALETLERIEETFNMKRIVFFEGPDGVGKTTQAKMFDNWLNSIGLNSIYVSNSTKTGFAKQCLDVMKNNDFSPIAQAFLALFNNQLTYDTIHKLLDEYDVIVVDRWVPSFIAYQIDNLFKNNEPDVARWLYSYLPMQAAWGFVLYDEPDILNKRLIEKNSGIDMFETDGVQKRVRSFYKNLVQDISKTKISKPIHMDSILGGKIQENHEKIKKLFSEGVLYMNSVVTGNLNIHELINGEYTPKTLN